VPLLLALTMLVIVVFAMIALLPISIIQRYRMGTSRSRARPWLVTLNVIGISLSLALFLVSAAVSNIWIPQAFAAAATGAAAGAVLGLVGLALTHWERTPGALHFTPNRWLVLTITLAVTGRLIYGVWRGWNAWETMGNDGSWLAASGAAGSLAAGALVLGYYASYWIGVRRRVLPARQNQPRKP
jgi:hypothetical protein